MLTRVEDSEGDRLSTVGVGDVETDTRRGSAGGALDTSEVGLGLGLGLGLSVVDAAFFVCEVWAPLVGRDARFAAILFPLVPAVSGTSAKGATKRLVAVPSIAS